MIDRLHVDGGDEVERLFVDLQHVSVDMRIAGIVDHDVDAAESLHGDVHHLVEFGFLGHVGLDADGVFADLACHPLRAAEVDIGDDDLRALLSEALGHPLPETGRRTGDDGDLVFQSHAGPVSDAA